MNAITRPSAPAPPSFGQALPPRSDAEVLRFLAQRRSASALLLREPGPNASERDELVRLAARAPDHGKLFPWRFVVLEGEDKAGFVAALERIAERRADAAKARTALGKISTPPLTIAIVSRYSAGEIPEWEQRLSSGAVAMLLLLAAGAMGYGANWITDWYAYDEEALALLGLHDAERVAAFVHIGTPIQPPLERVRPDTEALTSHWRTGLNRTHQRPR